ncbi:hypothetical protein C0Q70_06536 [Pomacea canaliculata]|uniref:Small-subunit processome Utp12 domain-containing protein n=1 Tax=Pomacea canaliculata TaxID=400727 RepID=A0A2T7PPC2_POMCA|nr:hypothetical protein C0Q70_06536 [Pomacea canaliculata]
MFAQLFQCGKVKELTHELQRYRWDIVGLAEVRWTGFGESTTDEGHKLWYRNFKTFTSPRPVQFSCLAVDSSGDIVCAGGQDVFEIFVWSMQTGKLLEVLADHQGPVSCWPLVTVVPCWQVALGTDCQALDIFQKSGAKETLTQLSDVLALTFRPDGQELAVATLNAQIVFWNPFTSVQTGSIEGRHDLGYGRRDTDLVTGKTLAAGKAFTTLCYSADGNCVLAAGRSKNVCIYSVPDQLLLKKFEISCNHSFDGMEEFLDKRKMTDWGSLALVDEGQGDYKGKSLALPGVRAGDLSSRSWRPEVQVASVQFSPTGCEWAAASTEGLLIYSLDQSLVFDPFELEMDITPAAIQTTLATGDHTQALLLALRLNEEEHIQEVLESIPTTCVDSISEGLPAKYVDRLLTYVGGHLESTRHLEFYLFWTRALLTYHGRFLKQRSQKLMAVLRNLQKNLTNKQEEICKLFDHNKYTMEYLLAQSRLKRKMRVEEEMETTDDTEDSDSGGKSGDDDDDDNDEQFLNLEESDMKIDSVSGYHTDDS